MDAYFVLTDNDIRRLDAARNRKKETETDTEIKWTLEDDSHILMAASRVLIEELIQREGRNYQISLKCLLDWESNQKICCKDRNQFTEFQFRKLQESDRNEPSSVSIDYQDIDYLLENRIILARSISCHSLRLCTDPSYKKQQRNKKWDREAVRVYCEILEFDFSSLDGNQDLNAREQGGNPEKLYRALTSFNYKNVVQYLEKIKHTPRKGILYISSVSNYHEIWLLHRLERLLKEKSNLSEVRKINYDVTSPISSWRSSNDLSFDLGKKLGKDLPKLLRSENLILVFKNIDYFPKFFLEEVVIHYWNDLTASLTESQGFLVMVWLDRGKSNDWRDELSNWPMVYKLPISSNFVREDFQSIFGQLDDIFWQLRLGENGEEEIDRLWEQSQQGEIDKTLEAFYGRFNCKLAREPRWQSYP